MSLYLRSNFPEPNLDNDVLAFGFWGPAEMSRKIEALTEDEAAHVQRQRDWVRDHYDENSRHLYDSVEGKMNLLETIIISGWVEPSEKWKLQSLGVTFGDAMAQKLGLFWVAVEDEHGRDPALHDPGTTILVYPLTSISKRLERAEKVDIRELFERACESVARLRDVLPSHGPH